MELASGSFDDLACFGGDYSEFVLAGSDDLLSVVGKHQIGGRLVEVVGGVQLQSLQVVYAD